MPPLTHNARYKPDIVITERRKTMPLTWRESKLTGEVKPHNADNAASFLRKDKSRRKVDGGAVWTNEEYEDIAQVYHYASVQFQSRPQRGLFSFSVTGHFMRFWHWTPSGVAYTEGLDYLKRDDVKKIMTFFHAWEVAEPYQRGEDVALSGVENWADNYTFQEVKMDRKYHVRWKEILEYLSFSFGSQFTAVPKKPQMVYWRFKHGPVVEPVGNLRATVDYSQDAEDFDAKLPMPPQDYYFHVPVPGAMNEDPMKGRTGVLDPDQRCPRIPGDAVELVVIPYAIRRAPGLFSPATSCYAVHMKISTGMTSGCIHSTCPGSIQVGSTSCPGIAGSKVKTWWIRYVARALGGSTLTTIVESVVPKGATAEVEM
jgi:hypothetical protein